MIKRYKVSIEYCGTSFSGWQIQAGPVSVQQTLQDVMGDVLEQQVILHASGRTDAGVHAYCQVAHFDCIPINNIHAFINSVNFFLRPYEICIYECREVAANFHARFDAIERSYIYKIVNRKYVSIIDRDRSWLVYYPLDVQAMDHASSLLVGSHDFSAFRASGCQAKSPVRRVYSAGVQKLANDRVVFEITACSFLYHMVRNIVGALVLVGKGDLSVESFGDILVSKDASMTGNMAPACGLYLAHVLYP